MNQDFSKNPLDKAVVKIIKARSKKFLQDRNVVGLAVGRKIRGSKRTNKPCLTFFVAKKVSKKYLPENQILPASFDEDGSEVITDVVESGTFYALPVHTYRERPARPGVSIGHVNISAGTLGAIVVDNNTGDQVILSNNHVLADSNNASIGDEILQPGPRDGGSSPSDVIGKLLRFHAINFSGGTNYVDGALCKVINSSDIQNTPHDGVPAPSPSSPAVGLLFAASSTQTIINPISRVLKTLNISLPTNSTINETIGMNVQKTGRTTGYSTHTIRNIAATVIVSYYGAGSATFSDQIITGNMCEGGDSGSLVIRGGSGGDDEFCAGSNAVSSLINQDLSLDRIVARQFRDEMLKESFGGRRLLLFYKAIEDRIPQVTEALSSKKEEVAKEIVEKFLPLVRQTYVDPTDPDLVLQKDHLVDIKKLYNTVRNELSQKETVFSRQIIQLADEFEGKKPSDVLEYFEDHEFTKRIPTGFRYSGNINTMEVHNLDKLTNNCQIIEIVKAKHIIFFETESLEAIHSMGFDNCHYCIGQSTR